MIRFSAGLVVVAIGVLIGGVATSKLSLVYVAIAVSAVALVVLAIGVALKRDELFGGGPELAPAGAGADSGMPAGQSVGAGDVRGNAGHVREDQKPIQPKKVPGPATAAFEAAAAASAASAAAPTVAAPSVTTPPVALADGGPRRGQLPVREPAVGAPPDRLRPGAGARGRRCRRLADALAAASVVVRRPGPPDLDAQGADAQASPPTVPQSGAAPVFPRARGETPTSRPRRRRGPDREPWPRAGSTG